MVSFIISLIGFFLIFCAVDVNRTEDSRITLFSRKWFIVIVLVLFGVSLIEIAHNMDRHKVKAPVEQSNNTIGSTLTDNSYYYH